MEIKVVDLFCGVGGLTCGLKKSGLNVVAGIDNDSTCKFAYEYNNKAKFIEADISKFSSEEFNSLYKGADIKILVGCAPCQTFSSHTKKNKERIKDKKWTLLDSFSEHINKVQPDIVSMENVPELMKFDIFTNFCKNLKKQGYNTSYQVVNCAEYGMPQRRKRLVLLASKLGSIALIPPSKKIKTLADAIKGLPALKNGQSDKKDPLHRCAGLTEINLKRIRQSKPGGTWRDWDEELLPNCYRKASGQSYSSVYGRMKWDQPSPTMTTQFFSFGTGRFGHPEQDRALSLREGALLQTFPKKYKFFQNEENMSICVISRHIGNAVPVDLGKIIGESINNHLREVGSDGE
ncbi:MAG: DNA cytosine methyltransferase [Alphaproteobacteria bacterium]|jgi:DNA (cytosine-5)-methyltransferase 1|nr:DNA cytosine methyltransferase [Alphaproteobacteria bacterium]